MFDEISTELQLTMDLTLDGAIQKARHSELVKGQVSNQKGGVVEEIKHPKENYHYSTQFRGRSHGRTTHGQYRGHGRGYNTQHAHRGARGGAYGGQGPQPTDRKCNKCGKPAHSNWRNCPARQDECHSCQRVGHWSKFCPSVDELTEDMSSQFFLGSVTCADTESTWKVTLPMYNTRVGFKIDTGADTSIISADVYNSLGDRPKLQGVSSVLKSPGGALSCRGKFVCKTTYKGKTYHFTVHVINGQVSSLLSRSVSLKMGLVKLVQEVNDDIGLLSGDPVKIHLKEGAQPFSLTTSW